MSYMLDTNICIYLIKRRPQQVLQRLQTYNLGEICVSSITVAELQYGVDKSRHAAQNQAALDLFLAPLEIAPFDAPAAQHTGRIRAKLERQGTPIRGPIGAFDLLIAGHARSLGCTLVTNNGREFSRVPGLVVEDWV